MTRKFWLSASLAAIGIMSSAGAFAWTRVGVFVGAPWPYYYPYSYPYPAPYYYPQPVVVQQLPPPVYVQQPAPMAAPSAPSPQSSMWYHCNNPKGYYPYVQQCPGGWKMVAPTPSAPRAPPPK